MPFVKLDTGILNSTLWVERECREVFITALLMASPREITKPMPQIKVHSMELTGFIVVPGWYGFVPAAGVGILRQACVGREEGLKALEALGNPDEESRSKEYEGRRLVRVDGGYVILNYMKYRDFDHGAADRMRRLRARKAADVNPVNSNSVTVTRNVTHSREQIADAEVPLKPLRTFVRPTLQEVQFYCQQRCNQVDPEKWLDHYTANGFKVGRAAMRDWKAAVRTWERSNGNGQGNAASIGHSQRATPTERIIKNRQAIVAGLNFGEES
jgi:hypothetical protein